MSRLFSILLSGSFMLIGGSLFAFKIFATSVKACNKFEKCQDYVQQKAEEQNPKFYDQQRRFKELNEQNQPYQQQQLQQQQPQ